jgi:hypothetical protein
MKRMMLAVCVALVALFAVPGPAWASGPQDGKVVFGGSFTLGSGETLDGDLAVLGGVVVLMEESTVEGEVALIGGTLTVNGEIKGGLTIVGGAATLGETAFIGGDLLTFGAAVSKAEGARIEGEEITGAVLDAPFQMEFPQFVQVVRMPWSIWDSWAASSAFFVLRALVLAGLAALVLLLAPEATARTARAFVRSPVNCGALGVLTELAAPVFIVLLAITICLIPFSLAAMGIFVIAAVFGWIAVSLELGTRLAAALKWAAQPPLAAGLGSLTMSLVTGTIGLIPCVGWVTSPLIVAAAIALGLGAVITTRFGSREYVVAAAALIEPPKPAEPLAPPTPPPPPSQKPKTRQ